MNPNIIISEMHDMETSSANACLCLFFIFYFILTGIVKHQ